MDLLALRPNPGRPFGLYIHVPFCITRCGYCDFNTYTPAELGGVNPDAWLNALGSELELAAARLGGPTVGTVFVGGGPRRCWAANAWPRCWAWCAATSSWLPTPR